MSTIPPLRITHVIATPEGAPWLVSIVREQRRRGHDVSVVLPSLEGRLATIFKTEGVPFETASFDLGPRTWPALWNLALLLRRMRPDVVVYHLFPSIVIGRLAGWLADVPLRFSMIPGTYYLEAPILGQIEAGTAWADTRVIATCEKTRDLYAEHGVSREHVEVIYYGLDGNRFDPARADGSKVRRDLQVRPDQPLIGLVAYFYPPSDGPYMVPPHLVGKGVKGHETVLAAIPAVIARYPDARFVFVGRGWGPLGEAYADRVKQLAVDLGVQDSVIFAGERADVPDTLAALDVALQVSLCENLGGSIEALTMARPLIATRVGGLVDSVKHEQTGLLIEPEDAHGLAQAILRLLDDRALADRLGQAGRVFMRSDFSLEKTCDDLDALFLRTAQEARLDSRRPTHTQRYRFWVSAWRIVAFPVQRRPLITMLTQAFAGRFGRAMLRRLRAMVTSAMPRRFGVTRG